MLLTMHLNDLLGIKFGNPTQGLPFELTIPLPAIYPIKNKF